LEDSQHLEDSFLSKSDQMNLRHRSKWRARKQR
jgi:hypothetical protein